MTSSSHAVRRPTVDEWGVYDPQQAGLVALFTRLTAPQGPRPEPAPVEASASPSVTEPRRIAPPKR